MPSRRLLILFAHPALHKSRVNQLLLSSVESLPGVTINDLYEAYPNFHVNVAREQALLLEHDVIVFQHPFYWYSSPAILKQWQDLVLEYGFAFGKNGTRLHGKLVLTAISTGGPSSAAAPSHRRRHHAGRRHAYGLRHGPRRPSSSL